MPDDFRFSADYFSNVKVRRLRRRLGNDGVISHLTLLCYVRKHRPSGEMTGMDAEAIAMAAEWSGDADQFCSALSELILIERSDANHWRIHDWTTVNEWASGSEGRRAHARKLNHKRWYVGRGVACADPQCVECEPFRPRGSVLKSEQTATENTSESVKESTSRPVTSKKTTRKKNARKKAASEESFEEASDAYRLSALLLSLVQQRDALCTADLQQWAADVDKLIRIDRRSADEIERVIRWSQADYFWCNNVLSAAALRKQFHQLFLKSKQQAPPPLRAVDAPTQKPSQPSDEVLALRESTRGSS